MHHSVRWVLLASALSLPALGQTAYPSKQANIGDSISQGFGANGFVGDQPSLSWAQGTSDSIRSVYLRLKTLNPSLVQEPESVSGAQLVGGGDSFAAQAQRVCAQAIRPHYVPVLLGGNDVCGRPRSSTSDAAANMYSVATWRSALRAGLDQLAACLPEGSTVHVLSMPRVDLLYGAGHAKSFWCPYVIWPVANVCRIVTGETSAGRRAQIGARINQYNDVIREELAAYDGNWNGQNPRHLRFRTDWRGSIEQGFVKSSVGTYGFTAADINGFDCFHPNAGGHKKLACAAWATHPHGDGTVAACLP